MRRIITSAYMSLDGVVQRPELWTFDYRSDDAARFAHEQLFGSDALLMGRHTYQIFAGHWPDATDEEGFADRMNTLPKYVVSDTLDGPAPWDNTIVVPRHDAPRSSARSRSSPGRTSCSTATGRSPPRCSRLACSTSCGSGCTPCSSAARTRTPCSLAPAPGPGSPWPT